MNAESDTIIGKYGYPMPPEAVAERLERTNWSRDFEWKDIASLGAYLKACMVPDGQCIMRESDDERFLCILLAGEAVVVKNDQSGQRKELATISTGKAFGEQSLFEGKRRSATIEARGECRLLVLTYDNLRFMEVEDPRLACKLLFKLGVTLSERLRMTSAQLVDAA